ncbi:MAG: hypothetical protein ACETVN_04115 [Asgard group archaeon]
MRKSLFETLTKSQQEKLDREIFLRRCSGNLSLRSCIKNTLKKPIEDEKVRKAVIYEGKFCGCSISEVVFLFGYQPDFKKKIGELEEEVVFLFLDRKTRRPCRELKLLGICDLSCDEAKAKSKKKAKNRKKPKKSD